LLTQQIFSGTKGYYTFDTQQGTYSYSVDTLGTPYLVNCPPGGINTSVISATDSIDTDMDFGLQCKTGIDLGVVAVNRSSGLFFPGNTSVVNVTAGDLAKQFNLTCASGISGTVVINYTGPVQFSGNVPGSLLPSASPNTLTYTIADFGTVDINSDFMFFTTTNTNATIGQQVCFSVSVNPIAQDINPSNNLYTHCFPVVNSYDPNVKEVNPMNIITSDGWLLYTIHFQNTGSAAAQNIIITDTLDADVQEGTFTYLGSSHNAFVNVTGNVVKFTFPNINLPDSTTNEPGSHGYVQFKIKADPGLALGTTIENTANIYFDFNPPVITNTTVNNLVLPTGIAESGSSSFQVYPNPAIEAANILTDTPGEKYLKMYDFSGRLVLESVLYGHDSTIHLKDVPPGIYTLQIANNTDLKKYCKLIVTDH
jgi:uncharacterized repeat protein (TIGR01451 family)